jgi:ribosomal protein S18 acetylase RimI-like enzyme
MLRPEQLRPALLDDPALAVRRAPAPAPELSRFLYVSVGADWHWTDRLGWSLERWREYLAQPSVETWVAYLGEAPAGYFELERQPAGAVEIAYFGLLAGFRGRGIGGHLLTVATRRAWEAGARRVWLHTGTLDGPHALRNYESRGFRVFQTRVHEEDLPDRPREVSRGRRGG